MIENIKSIWLSDMSEKQEEVKISDIVPSFINQENFQKLQLMIGSAKTLRD